jgi:hypothetical protein
MITCLPEGIKKFCLVTYLIFSIQGSDILTQSLVGQTNHINRSYVKQLTSIKFDFFLLILYLV